MHEVEALGEHGGVAVGRGLSRSGFGRPAWRRPSPVRRRGLDRRWVRFRSGSPSGATRSSTWKISTDAHGTSSCASSANMAHGVCPPLTANVKRPWSARHLRAICRRRMVRGRFGERRRGRRGHRARGALAAQAFDFSAWPPNSERIAERILSVNSPLPRDSKRSIERRGDHRRRDALCRSPPAPSSGPRPSPRPARRSRRARASGRGRRRSGRRARSRPPSPGARPRPPRRRRCRTGRPRGRASGVVSASTSAALSVPASACLMMLRPSAMAAIIPYSMPLWTIFTKWPAPFGPQCR